MSQSITLPSLLKRYPNFSFLLLGRFLSTVAMLTNSVTLGWQVYSVARLDHSVAQSSFLVGMIGLVQFLPMFALVLLAGETADRYDRRKILMACIGLQLVCSGTLAAIATAARPSLIAIFAVAAVFGIARAFTMPASASLGPMLVPREVLPRAIGVNSLAMQTGMVLGPWLGGVLCAVSVPLSFAAAGALYLVAGIAVFLIRANTKPDHAGGARLTLIAEGLAYVWSNKVVFGAISLDLFAVLLGGVTALLPVFARDILHIGAEGFGLLRSAPAIGGGLMALALSMRPIHRDAGFWMLCAVAVYGVATVVFAMSTWIVALDARARDARRRQFGIGLRAPEPGADPDSRPHARARDGRLEPVHQRVERARRVRERRCRALPRPHRRGDLRRRRLGRAHRAVGADVPEPAQGASLCAREQGARQREGARILIARALLPAALLSLRC